MPSFGNTRYTYMVLTIRQINATKPGTKIITLSDGMGLELRISTNGSRGWRLRYTRPNGKRNMISQGIFIPR
ncbi:Arm DNA-binding domain-containing protein [Vreelandella titanicae]|uniref:Arm DNA-binding domain-containing protein n=2 Tax=Vreelandella titanicae TaxID=664683 RepID=UPI0039BF7823